MVANWSESFIARYVTTETILNNLYTLVLKIMSLPSCQVIPVKTWTMSARDTSKASSSLR